MRPHWQETARRSERPGVGKIEILVASILFAVLAGCAKPVADELLLSSRQAKALEQAKTIAESLKEWSVGADGVYPHGDHANDAFAQLFPEIGSEKLFYVSGSAWHGEHFADGPDEVWDKEEGIPRDESRTLESGENHWAFNVEADTESPGHLPLIADGFSSIVGTYSPLKHDVGGVWEGKSAIIINCDFSGEIVDLDSEFQYKEMRNGKIRNVFKQHGVEMINPVHPVIREKLKARKKRQQD